jgi:uncharacterized protein (TIGR02001 family)
MTGRLQRFAGRAVAAVALMLLAGPAFADGYKGSLKDAPKPEERCKHTANVALTTDYVFRGFSQTAEGPAVQGGFDLTCGIFYAGVWASSLNWGDFNHGSFDANNFAYDASVEMDWYIGIRPVTGRITWDLGVIYYTYPNAFNPGLNVNYFELKVGASSAIWKDGTVGVTVYWSPDYQLESGSTWTFEGNFTQTFHKFQALRREWTPSFSATVGYQVNDENKLRANGFTSYQTTFGNGDDSYWYWNAGLTFGFLEKWSIDFRYWDTSLKNASATTAGTSFCRGSTFQCDERFVATLKFAY